MPSSFPFTYPARVQREAAEHVLQHASRVRAAFVRELDRKMTDVLSISTTPLETHTSSSEFTVNTQMKFTNL